MVLLDTGTAGTSREICSEDADGEIRTRNLLGSEPSALAIELNSSKAICWEVVEFIQLVYCIIIYLSLRYGTYGSKMNEMKVKKISRFTKSRKCTNVVQALYLKRALHLEAVPLKSVYLVVNCL